MSTPTQTNNEIEMTTRADRRRALRELHRQVRYQESGFYYTMKYEQHEGSRSKYTPHIGAKEKGRYL